MKLKRELNKKLDEQLNHKVSQKFKYAIATLVVTVCAIGVMVGCGAGKGDNEETTTKKKTTQTTTKKSHPNTNLTNTTAGSYYKPWELRNNNLNSWYSQWCWERSAESEHFIVFWEIGFGENPSALSVPAKMRVNIKLLLARAEEFYKKYTEELEFFNPDTQNNEVSDYKIQIYLKYQEEWLATGSGYDNKVGALWINPSTCQPAGATIAHEIGHVFQYLTNCHRAANGEGDAYKLAFNYVYYDGCYGNGFWEQTAQWQSYTLYPQDMFLWNNMDTWFANYHRAFEHEWMRYQSYWLHFYLTEKHGITTVANLWKNSVYPEDALSCYRRLYLDNDLDKMYANYYEYAAKMATFDIDGVRERAGDYRTRYETIFYDLEDGFKQVAYKDCPEANGFNVVPIKPNGQQTITIDFEGLDVGSALHKDDPGEYLVNEKVAGTVTTYNESNVEEGWRYGFVALLNDGSRVYGEMHSERSKTVTFEVPSDAKEVYFVVVGAPEEYCTHGWDDKDLNDVQMPYKIRVR